MKKKLCRVLGLLLSFTMLSTDLGSIVVNAAGTEQEISEEIPEEKLEEEETPEEDGEESVSQDITVSDDRLTEDDNTASENKPGDEDTISENDAVEEEESASDNEADSDNDNGSEDDTDSKNYKVLDEDLIKIHSVSINATNYAATAEIDAIYSDYTYSQLAVLFTAEENAEFFPDMDYVTGYTLDSLDDYSLTEAFYSYDWYYVNGNYIHGYNIDLLAEKDPSQILMPNTTYTYRIVSYINFDTDDVTDRLRYYFVTQPATFTTGDEIVESAVTVGDITIKDKGYLVADIEVAINNPNNEKFGKVEVVEKNDNDAAAEVLTTLYYNSNKNVYTGKCYKNEKGLRIRTTVYTGKGEEGYVYKDFEPDLYPAKDAKLSVSYNESDMTVIAEGSVSPYYPIDDLRVYMYYKKTSDASWYKYTISTVNQDGSFAASLSPSYDQLAPDTEYQYYLVIMNNHKDYNILMSDGSKEQPYIFKTGSEKKYSASDFKDPGLYELLLTQYGEYGITNTILESITGYYYYNDNKDCVIGSLEDFPDKLPNVSDLILVGQDITDISPLLEMKYLDDVNLVDNDIADLPNLSGLKCRSLNLNNNLIDSNDVSGAQIPAGIKLVWSTRQNKLNTAKTYYIDKNGTYPIVLEYSGKKYNHDYSVSISVNGTEHTYTDWDRYSNVLTICTAKDDFNPEKGKDYSAVIKINDGSKDVFTDVRSFCFKDMPLDPADVYVSSMADDSININLYTTVQQDSDNYESVTVVKDGKIYYRADSLYSYSDDLKSKLYGDDFNKISDINSLDYNVGCLSAWIYCERVPESGDYDICLTPRNGESIKWNEKVHVSASAVVTHIDSNLSGYDYFGDFYYIQFSGYNINKDDAYPVICDSEGNEYTTCVLMKRIGNNAYLYKLKKNNNWKEINNTPDDTYYYIVIKGKNFIDNVRGESKRIKAEQLKDKTYCNLIPIQNYYNWKTKTFEFTYDSTVKKGMELNYIFYADSSKKKMVGKASAVVGDKNIVSVKPLDGNGDVYIPEDDVHQYYNVYYDDTYMECAFYISYYNRSWYDDSDYFNIGIEKSYYTAPLSGIEVNVSTTPKKYSADVLYARIKETDETIVLKYTAEKDYDSFKSGAWEFTSPLTNGNYTLEIYRKAGEDEEFLGGRSFCVRNPEKFYVSYIGGNRDYSDLNTAYAQISMPYADVPDSKKESEIQKIVDMLKLKVEVFDVDLKPVSGLKITPYMSIKNYGAIYFKISGLSDKELGYYVRFTIDGKTPIYADNEEEYYEYPSRGQMIKANTSFGFGMSSTLNAYYNVCSSGGKINAPFTVEFYDFSDPSELVHSMTIKRADLDDNGDYYFTKKDLVKIDPARVYIAVLTSDRGQVENYTGYFASRDNGASYDPDKITLKVNKKESITASLVFNTNGADPVGALYTIAKSGKSAKMTKLTKRGYTFKGWYVTYTDKKGKEKQKKVTSITSKVIKKYAIDSTLTLDAVFTPNKYSISYKKTAPAKKVKVKGKIKLAKEEKKLSFEGGMVRAHGEELSAEGYKLIGWTTVKNGTDVMIGVGEEKPVSELIPEKGKKITFYPVWEAVTPAE